jgi:hypothetical protein
MDNSCISQPLFMFNMADRVERDQRKRVIQTLALKLALTILKKYGVYDSRNNRHILQS